MTQLSHEQRARLEKLAAYLENLPPDYRHFDMGSFIFGSSPELEIKYALLNGGVQNCGTAACAAGHGPAAGILVPDRFVNEYRVQWNLYSQWLAGPHHNAWHWLFGPNWDACDNTHYGAAARIRYMLDKDGPPARFDSPYGRFMDDYAPYLKQEQMA